MTFPKSKKQGPRKPKVSLEHFNTDCAANADAMAAGRFSKVAWRAHGKAFIAVSRQHDSFDLTFADFFVLDDVVNWMDAFGRCFRSYKAIASACGMTPTAIRNSLMRLRAAGLLEVPGRDEGAATVGMRGRPATVYVARWPALDLAARGRPSGAFSATTVDENDGGISSTARNENTPSNLCNDHCDNLGNFFNGGYTIFFNGRCTHKEELDYGAGAPRALPLVEGSYADCDDPDADSGHGDGAFTRAIPYADADHHSVAAVADEHSGAAERADVFDPYDDFLDDGDHTSAEDDRADHAPVVVAFPGCEGVVALYAPDDQDHAMPRGWIDPAKAVARLRAHWGGALSYPQEFAQDLLDGFVGNDAEARRWALRTTFAAIKARGPDEDGKHWQIHLDLLHRLFAAAGRGGDLADRALAAFLAAFADANARRTERFAATAQELPNG